MDLARLQSRFERFGAVFVAGFLLSLCCLAAQAGARAGGKAAPPKLTAAERRAVTISSVSAVADPAFGAVVTVKFKGDIERYFGQGNLKAGLLALGIASKQPVVAPAQLVAAGGGFTEMPVPILARAGGRLRLARSAVEIFGSDHVVRAGAPGQVTLLRSNNRLMIFMTGLGLAQAATLQLKVFAKSPPGVGQPPAAFRTLTASRWQKLAHTHPTGLGASGVSPAPFTVAQLQGLRGQLSSVLTATLQPQLRRQTEARAGLRTALDHYAALGGRLGTSRATLLAGYRAGAAAIAHLKREIAQVQKLIARFKTQIAATANPPVGLVQTDVGLSQQLATLPGLVTSTAVPQGVPVIHVDPSVRYQGFSGVGAAMPDSSAWLIGTQLAPSQRGALMQALFGGPGTQNALGVPAIHLNFLRLGIGAAGAMTVGAPYSYDDMPPGQTDPGLSNFSISRDMSYIVPTVQQALQVDPGLRILANPWSPPGWMKSNDALDNSGGQATLLPSAYAPLARYFVKFIQAYQSAGVPIAAVTPQNEPSSGQVGTAYPGLTLPEANEEQFISQNLGPALQAAGLQTKIYGSDLSWDSTAYAHEPGHRPGRGPARRRRVALLLRLSRSYEPAPPGRSGPRSDGQRMLAGDPGVRHARVPDLLLAQLGERCVRLERRARPQRGPDSARQRLPGLPGPRDDRRAESVDHLPARVLPARSGERLRSAGRRTDRL